jgi:Tfp pilus assembly PilM family ATPase
MPGYENHAGFNISNTKLQVVEINYTNDQFRLVNVNEAQFNDQIDFTSVSKSKFSALLQGAFDKLQSQKKINSKSISFTLPFELFYPMQIPYDISLLNQDLMEEFKWEMSVLYPFTAAQDLVLQFTEIEKGPFIEKNMALVFGTDRNYLKLINDFCSKNSLKLNFIDNQHIASERSLSISNAIKYKGLILSVYLSKKFLSIFFTFNGKALFFKTIPLNDFSEISDHLIRETSNPSILKFDKSQIDSFFIAGENVSHNLVSTLKKILGFDFILFNPFDKIRPLPELYESKLYLEKYNSFSSAAGIAFRIA